MITTTTTPSDFGALRAVPEPLESLGAEALSEVARAATLAQNLAAATRLQAAHHLVETFTRIDRDCHGQPGADQTSAGTETDTAGPSTKGPSTKGPTAGVDTRPAYARLDPAARARDHLAAAMKLTTWHAGQLVTCGVQLHTRLPRLRKAVDRGLFPEQLAIDTACRLAAVPDEIIGAVESDVVGTLARALDGGHRPSRTALNATVDTAVERHDPRAAQDAVDAAAEQRTVRFRPGRDGMTSMWANLPAGDAEKLRHRIDAAARAAQNSGHRRTRDQLRADALVALGDPTTNDVADPLPDDRPGDGNPWATDKPIRISVINSVALGLPNQVQFVTGAYASFDWLCEQLLSGGDAKVRFELIDPVPGVLDRPDAALKYFITPTLAERVRLRDGSCRHPGCTVEAQDCEIDHVIAFDHHRPELGGPTAEWNLVCLCRKHHREKTFGHCAYRPGPLGELTIITETDHEHHTRPTGPLALAREQILNHRWREHLDRLIAEDGLLTNPPGFDRPPRSSRRDTPHPA